MCALSNNNKIDEDEDEDDDHDDHGNSNNNNKSSIRYRSFQDYCIEDNDSVCLRVSRTKYEINRLEIIISPLARYNNRLCQYAVKQFRHAECLSVYVAQCIHLYTYTSMPMS